MALKSIKIQSFVSRTLLLAAWLVVLIFAVFFARWFFADSMAMHTDYKEVAELAVGLAPSDPQTHFALGALTERIFTPEDLTKSLSEYEKAVALAPNDYRFWFSLGKARERYGDAAGAELALRKSLELAPNYSQVQWTLGNVLLRKGKTSEGFAEIRRAAQNDPEFINPAIVTAWQIFNGDLDQIKQNVGDSGQANAALAVFLAKQKLYDAALEIWNALPAEQKKTVYTESGEALYNEFSAAKKYREALLIHSEISGGNTSNSGAGGTAAAGQTKIGQIANGGFENEVKSKGASIFEWQIADGLKPQIGFDDKEKHDGNRSLVIIFNSPDGKDFRGISQTVVVEAGKNYKFQTFYKSDLKTASTFDWEIVDAADGKVLATTGAVLPGSDWTNLSVEFNSANTEAVTIRLAREICKLSFCPISGKIWFDDFSISQ